MQKSHVHVLASFAALAVVSVSSSAHASSSTTCTGSAAVSYSPGLTFTKQTVDISETDTYTCTSTDTSLTSGGWSATISFPGASCASADVSFGPIAGGVTINWNNGQSSTLLPTVVTDDIVGGNEVFTGVGTVSSGEFAGADATATWIYPVLNPLLCLTSPGLTSQSGTVIVEITGL